MRERNRCDHLHSFGGSQLLIFIVDDEDSVREETEKIIRKAEPGAEILSFRRAVDALEAINDKGSPRMVFSDIEMPGLSGLEFAVKLKNISPDTRIVFVTGYRDYAIEAFRIKVHGYLLKPLSVEDVKAELKYVPEEETDSPGKLVVKCFGHFDVYWNGEPLIFSRKQSKELLAYLIDRNGAACSSQEIANALWREGGDNRAEQNRIRVLVNDLRNTLRQIGMEDLLIREHRELAIRRDMVDCDYFRMLDGDMDKVNAYRGEYMVEYSWAELTNAKLYFEGNK